MKGDKCGKCYQLNRPSSYCERYKTKLLEMLTTAKGVFIRCPKCIEEKGK